MKNIFSTLLIPLNKSNPSTKKQDEKASAVPGSDFVFTAFCECDKFFYIGTNHGLLRKNKQTGKLIFLTQNNSALRSNHITSITCDRKGIAYIGTQCGIFMWHNKNFHQINKHNSSVADDPVTAMTVDLEDDLWIGTRGKALLKSIGDKKMELRTHPIQSYDDNIYSITLDPKGSIWVVLEHGIMEYFQQGYSHSDSSIPSEEDDQLVEANTFLLRTPTDGAFLTDGTTFKNLIIEPAYQSISCSYYNPKYSRLMICNNEGVNVFSIRDPWSGPKPMRYSAFIKSISCLGSDRTIVKLITQLEDCENVKSI